MLQDSLLLQGADPAEATPTVHTLPELVQQASRNYPNKQAWYFQQTGQSVTFGEIEFLVSRVASALAGRGVSTRSSAGLITENTIEFPISWLALSWMSVPMVPINNRYGKADAAHLLKVARLKVVIASRKFVDFIQAVSAEYDLDIEIIVAEELLANVRDSTGMVPVVDREAIANIQFTSGTTGNPKGCLLGHDYWLQIAHTLTTEFPNISGSDTMLTAQGFYYIDPQWNLITSLYSGARLIILDGFHPSTFWEQVREYGVTYFYCLGMMPNLLLKMPPSDLDLVHKVRVIQASAIPISIHQELVDRWGVGWYEAFGMTETGADLFVGEQEGNVLIGSGIMGRPRNHRQVQIVDDQQNRLGPDQIGNLMLTGPGMMRGYFNDPDSSGEAMSGGWFATGDLASYDSSGLISHRGRTKDIVRRSGENISAVEVETILNTHESVHLSGLIAIPDPLKGEEPMAFIQTKVTVENEIELFESIAAHCAAQLAKYKVPRYWKVIGDMPLTVSERVSKAELKKAENLGNVWDSVTNQIVERVQV